MPIAWHAPYELLKPETRDMSRAIHSVMEELEAMDWYSQRVDVTDDEGLRRILKHHAEEEKEHAAMLIEWIRRHDPEWDEHLRKYLFTTGDIIGIEEQEGASEGRAQASPPAAGLQNSGREEPVDKLTVGNLRPAR